MSSLRSPWFQWSCHTLQFWVPSYPPWHCPAQRTQPPSEKWKLSNRKKILQYISLLLPYRRTRRKVREDKERRSAGVADLQCLHIIYCLSERRTKTKTKNQRGQRQRDMQKKELLPNSVYRSSTAVVLRTASLSSLKLGVENPPILQVYKSMI